MSWNFMVDQININGGIGNASEKISLEQRFGVSQEKRDDVFQNRENDANTEQIGTEKDGAYGHILSQVQSSHDAIGEDHGKIMHDASTLHQKMDRESQIKHLIDLAMSEGVQHAVKVAQKAEDYYILDQLHDRLLADDFHAALKARGMIE